MAFFWHKIRILDSHLESVLPLFAAYKYAIVSIGVKINVVIVGQAIIQPQIVYKNPIYCGCLEYL